MYLLTGMFAIATPISNDIIDILLLGDRLSSCHNRDGNMCCLNVHAYF